MYQHTPCTQIHSPPRDVFIDVHKHFKENKGMCNSVVLHRTPLISLYSGPQQLFTSVNSTT